MAANFNTENKTFHTIMGNGLRYVVPKFQRDYTWSEEQWEDLWQDIDQIASDGKEHYMGFVVLQEGVNNREFIIIDGQQRITTLLIIIIAALNEIRTLINKNIEPEQNKLRFDTLKNTYVGFTDPVSLVTQNKLTLNRNNDAFFRNYLCSFEPPPITNIKSSEKLLSKAQNFFISKIKSKAFQAGEQIADFVERIFDKLAFSKITVGSDLNAYEVFETLNARGVKLSTPDLIKNYLFSKIDSTQPLHSEEIQRLEDDWERILSNLGQNGDFSRLVQVEWNSRKPFVQKNRIFKTIKENIKNRESAFEYLRSLRSASEIFAALAMPDDDLWKSEEYKDAYTPLRTLDLFSIAQPDGVLIAAYKAFEPQQFVKTLKYIEVISIRYNVIGRLPPNRQEGIYNNLACEISNGQITNLSAVKAALKALYPDDEDFANSFADKQMKTEQSEKKARYLLARIEERLNNGSPVVDLGLTLEHILPKNTNKLWSNFSADEANECYDYIGNMTLLQRSVNKNIGNSSFAEKLSSFTTSTFNITQQITEYETWDKETIMRRQKWLAEQATKTWKIEF